VSGLVPTFCVQADLIRSRRRNTLWPLRLDLDFRSFEASGLPLTLGRLADSGTAGLG
jgi:hypothetical protein